MSTQFSGSLQTKKKGELQLIARELREIDDTGTRDDLVKQITRFLESNPNLESDTRFAGLYTSRIRQRSLQPSDDSDQYARTNRRSRAGPERSFSPVAEEVERESSTPPAELTEMMMMLGRAPQSPGALPTPPRPRVGASPRNIALPPTPAKSVVSSSEALGSPKAQHIVKNDKSHTETLYECVEAARSSLSSAKNMFIITAIFEYAFLMYQIHQENFFGVPPLTQSLEPMAHITFYATLHWIGATVILPCVAGHLMLFWPARVRFDPLSASIIRLASNYLWFFPTMQVVISESVRVHSLDVLGPELRMVSAAVTLAFAFADALKAKA